MNLYAAGFNAWRQLQFSPHVDSLEEPDDIASFQKVLTDELIQVRYASLTCTIVGTSSGLQYAGVIDEGIELAALEHELLSNRAAVAGNGMAAVYDGHGAIVQYASQLRPTEARASQTFSGMRDIVQLVAFETGFVALSRDGKVWTWGDERYAATLGRDITASSPADRPGLVEDLEDLPTGKIEKIAAGGYTVLALTEGYDLYAWGGHPARPPILGTLSGSPSPVDVEENDILDFSVGEAHIIVLNTGGDVYIIGDNTNGQLGLPAERAATWEKVPLSTAEVGAIIGVKAGHRSSFIVTENTCLA
ncbi:regulator of chromosome condensation 1/beta-lactamase-inhibitor protein II [Nemania sp. NC0429]|nr:regulator of chromosome condensation 1/beta-lactamase-inhibitor protein II [Nemania sp. NC0429]